MCSLQTCANSCGAQAGNLVFPGCNFMRPDYEIREVRQGLRCGSIRACFLGPPKNDGHTQNNMLRVSFGLQNQKTSFGGDPNFGVFGVSGLSGFPAKARPSPHFRRISGVGFAWVCLFVS